MKFDEIGLMEELDSGMGSVEMLYLCDLFLRNFRFGMISDCVNDFD